MVCFYTLKVNITYTFFIKRCLCKASYRAFTFFAYGHLGPNYEIPILSVWWYLCKHAFQTLRASKQSLFGGQIIMLLRWQKITSRWKNAVEIKVINFLFSHFIRLKICIYFWSLPSSWENNKNNSIKKSWSCLFYLNSLWNRLLHKHVQYKTCL